MDFDRLIADETKLINIHFDRGRSQPIRGIVLHHNAGRLSVQDCWNTWQTRKASAHYQVEFGGWIGQLVNDSDTAWHAGPANDWSIGIEHADATFAPTWTISERTLDSGAHLVAAICHYYRLGRPEWGRNVFGHSDFMSTACPGAIAGTQRDAYMARAQAYYDGTATILEDLMATFTDDEKRQLLDDVHTIAHTLTGGKEGVKTAGDLYVQALDAAVTLRGIDDKLTPGQAGVRTAGPIYSKLEDIHQDLTGGKGATK